MRRLLFILTVLALAGPAATAAHANVDTQEVLWLDMHQPGRGHPAGPVTTSGPLSSTRFYVAIVTGTVSPYDATRWTEGTICGVPESKPIYSSVGVVDAPVGSDAESEWAQPLTSQFCPALPRRETGFVMDWGAGNGFVHPVANGGPYRSPQPGHTYTYVLAGHDVAASFEWLESNTTDDDGMLRIVVRPAVKSECNGNAQCESTAPDVPPPPLPTDAPPSAPTPNPSSGGGPGTVGPLPPGTSPGAGGTAAACTSYRRFRVRLTAPRGRKFRSFSATVGGRRAKVAVHRLKGKRPTVLLTIWPHHASRATTTLRLTARMKQGRSLRRTLRYHRCASSGLRTIH